jgi:hypothetical protein
MLRKALLQGLLLTLGLTGTLAVSAGNMLVEDPPTIAGAPFSGVVNVQSTTHFADGNQIVRTNVVRYFRDGQGRTRTERQGLGVLTGSVTGVSVVTIIDPVKSQRINLFPTQQLASVMKLPQGMVHAATVSACHSDTVPPFALLGIGMALGAGQYTEATTSTVSLGQKVVNGLSATGCRIVRTIPEGVLGNEKPITSTTEQWVSSDLGVAVQVAETSSIGGSVTVNLEQAVLSEPEASLFTVPTQYKTMNTPEPGVGAGSVTSSGSVSVATRAESTSSAGSH